MAQVPEVVLDLYEGIPKACFVAGVPFTLRGFEDNEVIPCFDTVLGPDGVAAKWVRFCDYYPFVDALEAFWMGSMELELQGIVPPVYVYVMPYTPLNDAWCLHKLIHDAHEIIEDFEMQPVELDQEVGAAAPLKQGTVEFRDGHNFSFFVVNYNLLYSKVHQYRVLSYVTDPLHEALHRFEIIENLLNASTGGATADHMVLAANDAKRRLALVLMEQFAEGIPGVDPHDALLTMFPDVHNAVYQDHCKCHTPDGQDQDPSVAVIESAMQDLGYEELDDLSVTQAEKNLMTAEGTAESHDIHGNARGNITDAINPTIQVIRVAMASHSLMGVITDYEDGDPEEGN